MENEKKKSPMKNKIALAVMGVIVVGVLASSFIGPMLADMAVDKAKSAATGAGRLAYEKGKEKLHNKLEDMKTKQAERIAENVAAQVDSVSNNVLKNVESDKLIEIDKVPTPTEFADTMLINAVKAGDLDRVKNLLDSGVNVSFTDDKICFAQVGAYDHKGSFDVQTTPVPKDVVEMKTFIAVSSAKRQVPLTTKCEKLFLLTAASLLNNRDSEKEFFYYNHAWLSDTPQERMDSEKDKMAGEKIREEIYKLILSKTPVKDYYQLPFVFLNMDVPTDLRMDALNKFLANDGKLPVTEKRSQFLKVYDEAANQMLAESPNSVQSMKTVAQIKNPWVLYFTQQTKNLFEVANILEIASESVKTQIKQELKFNASVASLEVPVFTVKSMEESGIFYNESTNSGYWHYSANRSSKTVDKDNFQALYDVNREIKIINTIVTSKKVNLNYQDVQGNTILHYISMGITSSRPRTLGVLTRYLLNNGVNANLFNKQGKTSFVIAQEKDTGYSELSKAYTDKNYN